jgi:hypothetical protein
MNRLFFILSITALTACNQTIPTGHANQAAPITGFQCSTFEFTSVEAHADSLVEFMTHAQKSTSSERLIWEQKFFCAFPSSFKAMQSIFGYDPKNGPAPLFTTGQETNQYLDKLIMSDVIGFFNELRSIPDSVYFDKYIRINIDGFWQADNISMAFGLAYRLLEDTDAACKTLATFSDDEIKSVFRFIFDGPHPTNKSNIELYDKLNATLVSQDQRLSQLLTTSYVMLMAEEEEDHKH